MEDSRPSTWVARVLFSLRDFQWVIFWGRWVNLPPTNSLVSLAVRSKEKPPNSSVHTFHSQQKYLVGGFSPTHLKNMQPSNWIISPVFGVKIKNIRNHHLDISPTPAKSSWRVKAGHSQVFVPFCCETKTLFGWLMTDPAIVYYYNPHHMTLLGIFVYNIYLSISYRVFYR